MEKFDTGMYDRKYESKETRPPRSVVTHFVDTYLDGATHCLDLGSGDGRHSTYVAEKGIPVSAIDLSSVGVEKTAEALRDFPGSSATVGDIHSLPFEDGSFDSLVCNRVLDYNDDAGLETAFAEIDRVLKDGSVMLLTVRSTAQPHKTEEVLISTNPAGGQTFQVGDGEEKQHYFTEEELRGLAAAHSLEIVEMREWISDKDDGEKKAEWQAVMRKMIQSSASSMNE